MENLFWLCSFCRENDKTDINHSSQTKRFLRYVDDIVRRVRGDAKELLDAVTNFHTNLQFTLETTDDKNILAFLEMSINVQWGVQFFAHGIKNLQILKKFGTIVAVHPFNIKKRKTGNAALAIGNRSTKL